MIWYGIAAVVILLLVIFLPGTKNWLGDTRGAGSVVGFGVIALAIATAGNLAFMQYDYTAQNKVMGSASLETLQDSAQGGIHGSFFLGIGSVGSDGAQYSYYEHDADGSYSLHTLDAESDWYTVRVFQDNSTPRVDCIGPVKTRDHGNLLSVFGAVVNHHHECTDWDIHVPPGSIVHEYNLNAQ